MAEVEEAKATVEAEAAATTEPVPMAQAEAAEAAAEDDESPCILRVPLPDGASHRTLDIEESFERPSDVHPDGRATAGVRA